MHDVGWGDVGSPLWVCRWCQDMKAGHRGSVALSSPPLLPTCNETAAKGPFHPPHSSSSPELPRTPGWAGASLAPFLIGLGWRAGLCPRQFGLLGGP